MSLVVRWTVRRTSWSQEYNSLETACSDVNFCKYISIVIPRLNFNSTFFPFSSTEIQRCFRLNFSSKTTRFISQFAESLIPRPRLLERFSWLEFVTTNYLHFKGVLIGGKSVASVWNFDEPFPSNFLTRRPSPRSTTSEAR